MIKYMKTLVLGIGNTIRGDDGVGIFTARALREQIDSGVDIKETESAGLNLLEIISDYDKVVIIDSIRTRDGKPGEIYSITKDQLGTGSSPHSSHKIGLATIIKLANKLAIKIPDEIMIYAIEIEGGDSFCDYLSSKVKAAIPKVMNLVKQELSLGGVTKR